jgi:EAL domain-containing protein (putative c-di-GMP-specific phosphodiesterase class I)
MNQIKLAKIPHPGSRGSDHEWFIAGQVSDSDPARRVVLNQFPFVIGRRSDCQLCLPVACVSKNHAEVILDDQGNLLIRDLGSTNGTFVNGEQISGSVNLKENDLVHFATLVFRIGCTRLTQGTANNTIEQSAGDQALALIQFERLISDGGLTTHYQPLVRLSDQHCFGYEVLGRCRLFGLQNPNEMFQAASQLNLEVQLSEAFRLLGVQKGIALGADTNLFVNTHPKELDRPEFYDSLRQIREQCPEQAVTLEIHEAASTNMTMMRELCALLEDLNIMLAFDDFGVGKARLVELGEVRPDFLKFDMNLTRNIESAPPKRQELVALFANLVNNLGIQTLAEGVETEACHNTLVEMGFHLGQGYYYGRPAPLGTFLKDESVFDTEAATD